MLQRFVKVFGGDPNKRKIEEFSEIVDFLNSLEKQHEKLSDEELALSTANFRRRLAKGEALDELLPEAFAVVREISKRALGLRHYDVQLIGGIVLHQGKIAEMRTGEGKTLVATLPLYLNALILNETWIELAKRKWGADPEGWTFEPIGRTPVGRGVHLITVNDYLARRDARWMAPIYHGLGLSVGVLQMAARTESGRKAFIVDLKKESPHEDQHQLQMVPRQEAYQADIIYGTNSEFGFDYLRDNMAMQLESRVQRGHHYAIIDEVDNVLIDEARTPLIISGPSHDDTEWYLRMSQVVKQLRSEDYEVNEKDRNVSLSEIGETHVEQLLAMPLRDPERPEDITLEQARILGYLEQALRAQHLFKRNKDYLVQGGKVVIVDEFTGRLMPGRRWSDGLHQAVEAKEGVKVQRENVTYATITIQNYFRMYEKLAGMTGTAVTESEEFHKIYKLDVLAIPTNLEYVASRPETDLVAIDDQDENGYKYTYYGRAGDPDRKPLYYKRQDFPDVVYRTEEAKLRAVTQEIMHFYVKGRPVLVGTTSVELSEHLSNRLKADPISRLAQVLMLRDVWFQKHDLVEDGRQIPELELLNNPLDILNLAEMRKLARDLDITLNPQSPNNLPNILAVLGLEPADQERLVATLKGGVPHQVLNARKHTEESQIIADAGAFGGVTIATNMAGRGVDIKLGGELPEEIQSSVARVLRRAGYDDPYDMSLEQRRDTLLNMDPGEFGIYEAEIQRFLQQIKDMDLVRQLGGLHVIGSERHEARRIDNQLRGRSARQGDPGSSRFYLSMEDELMRLFGGQQANDWMARLNVDEAIPLEHGMVGRIIEQAQTRVEGANFDARKHLLEYDDVLNTQREKIYGQRDRIFTKDDLSDDVDQMLQTEIEQRVPAAMEDEEGPWRLLAWLDQIQPTISIDGIIFPSYTLRTLAANLGSEFPMDPDAAFRELLQIARGSLDAEEEHLLQVVDHLLFQNQAHLEQQLEDRMEMVDTFVQGLALADETDTRGPRELLDELSGLVGLSLKLSPSEQRALQGDPDEVLDTVREQVETALLNQTLTRLIGAIERRLEEPLGLSLNDLSGLDWDELSKQVLAGIQQVFERRRERFLGASDDGQIAKDLSSTIAKLNGNLGENQIYSLLMVIPQGARATFDRKTHRRVWERTTRLRYVHLGARHLEQRDPDELAQEVLEHLKSAKVALQRAWGRIEVQRLAGVRLAEFDERTQRGLRKVLPEDVFRKIEQASLKELDANLHSVVVDELGRQALTEVYRQLLLGVISELWVDYLTQMEALRVSIGLEAYAQRDPLVQYKSRAFEMFQRLVEDMRNGVVTRMFTFRPRDLGAVQTEVKRSEEPKPEPATVTATSEPRPAKRRRRRRRRKR